MNIGKIPAKTARLTPAREALIDVPNDRRMSYGELDERVNAGIDDMMAALESAGTTHDHRVYEGAAHAFHNHTNEERYHEPAARLAWADALAWFGTHLKG